MIAAGFCSVGSCWLMLQLLAIFPVALDRLPPPAGHLLAARCLSHTFLPDVPPDESLRDLSPRHPFTPWMFAPNVSPTRPSHLSPPEVVSGCLSQMFGVSRYRHLAYPLVGLGMLPMQSCGCWVVAVSGEWAVLGFSLLGGNNLSLSPYSRFPKSKLYSFG